MDSITFTSSQITFLIVLAVWELIWKGIALWKSAISREKIWFVFILVVNSVGILPIIYLLFFNREQVVRIEKRVRKKVVRRK